MAEVGKVIGPSGSPDNSDKKTTAADAEKFAEARKRVEQVSAVDPDEHKKRKRQEEAEEEEPLLKPFKEPTPPSQVPAFMLPQPKQPGLLGTEQGSYPSLPAPPSSPSAPSSYETSFNNSPPVPQEEQYAPTPSSQTQEPSQTSSPSTSYSSSTSTPTQQSQSPSGSKQTSSTQTPAHKGKEPEKSTKSLPDSAKKIDAIQDTTGFFEQLKAKGTLPPKTPELPNKKAEALIEKGTQPTKEAPELPNKKVEGLIEEGSQLKKIQELPNKEVEALIEGGGISTTLSPVGAPLGKGTEEKKSGELEAALLEGGAASTLPGGGPPLIKPPESISSLGPYARLSPQVQELFDKMVGVMTVMHLQGLTETTFTLNSPKFASSVFFGAQIIIKEFSTAPQALNVQLNGSMQAVALFQANTGSLMAAFQAGNYNFKINRLETNYVSDDRPLFQRKEGSSDQQNKDQGDQSR